MSDKDKDQYVITVRESEVTAIIKKDYWTSDDHLQRFMEWLRSNYDYSRIFDSLTEYFEIFRDKEKSASANDGK